LKTTGFFKRILGTKKVVKAEDKPATELTLRLIETQLFATKEILNGMAESLKKTAQGMDSLSRYFEFEIERSKKIAEFEDTPPTKADLEY
jgi:hypothetical protein